MVASMPNRSTRSAHEAELREQIGREFETIEDWTAAVLNHIKQQGDLDGRLLQLQRQIQDIKRKGISTGRAVVTTVVLIAILAVDYLLFFPVIDFFLRFAFGGGASDFELAVARVLIPIGFLIIELTIAHLRSRAVEGGSTGAIVMWRLVSILFGLMVAVAVGATFISAAISPESTMSIDVRVFYLLLFFLVVVALVCHYIVIFGGEQILLAGEILAERVALGRAKTGFAAAEDAEKTARGQMTKAYRRYHDLVHEALPYPVGDNYNNQSPFSEPATRVLIEQHPLDRAYFERVGPLFKTGNTTSAATGGAATSGGTAAAAEDGSNVVELGKTQREA